MDHTDVAPAELGVANNKPLRTLHQAARPEGHLRPFNKGNNMIDAVELRQELYRRRCCAIWGRAAPGFPGRPLMPPTSRAVAR